MEEQDLNTTLILFHLGGWFVSFAEFLNFYSQITLGIVCADTDKTTYRYQGSLDFTEFQVREIYDTAVEKSVFSELTGKFFGLWKDE